MIKGCTHLLIGLVLALTMLTGPVEAAFAQDSVFEDVVEHQPTRLDVNFPGGKLIDYVSTIRSALPKGVVNIVVMPNAQAIEVPPMSLVAVTVNAAVLLLEGTYTLPDGRRAEIGVLSYKIEGTTDMVFKVTVVYLIRDIMSSVWSLEEVLSDGQSERELLGAIDVVQSLFSDKAEIKYHPPTRLLIARGTREQLKLAGKVIDQLIHGVKNKRARIDELKNTIEDLMVQQHEFSTQLIDMDAELKQKKFILDQEIKEEGSDQPDAQDYMIELRSEVKHAQAQYNLANDRLNLINEQLKQVKGVLAGLQESR